MTNIGTMLACGAALWCAASSAAALAGTLQVNPILVQVDAGRRTATVTVRNEEAAPVTIRAYPLAWRQAGGDDHYDQTSAVIVSPPIFTIPAGGTQLVRVGLRRPGGNPEAYRLIVEEVPEARSGAGVQVALRLNLPFYSSLVAGDPGQLRWNARRTQTGIEVEVTNTGTGFIRVDAEMARAAIGIEFGDEIAFGTVLPGATRRWRVLSASRVADRARFEQLVGNQGHVAVPAGRD
jgi:fimbrial chaperone protein